MATPRRKRLRPDNGSRLIKYPGGKGWFVETMKQWFEPYRLTHAFVEPFAGSLALSLGLEPNK